MTKKGLCGYCLGEKTITVPVDNDPAQAELNNFEEHVCPVCDGTGEIDVDDIDDEDLPEDYPLTMDDVIIPDDLDEFIREEEDFDHDSNDINSQS